MAWRLNEIVTRGVIDNRQKGKVTGALWLIGQEAEMRLQLEGNCDAEMPDESLSEQALQKFDEYVIRFEELWEKYADDPDRDQKIADELGCTLVNDGEDLAEAIGEELSEGAEVEGGPTEYPEPLWWSDPLIIRAKDLCVAVSEFGKATKLDSSASGRLDDLQLRLVQGMAKLGDATHGVIAGNEARDPGLLVGLLKRSLSKYHLALETLNGMDDTIVPITTAQAWRAEILAVRQEVFDTMNRFQKME